MNLARHAGWIALSFFLSFCCRAGGDNIGPSAHVEVSTALDDAHRGEMAVDGKIKIPGVGEWACAGQTTPWGDIRFPWIRLTWDSSHMMDRIILFDRPGSDEHIAGGKLLFSDGTSIWVNSIPNDGRGKEVRFTSKKVKWLKFIVTDGTGKNLGLSEIEVYNSPEENYDYVSMVDPYIETNRGRYFFFVTGGRPFGMVGAAPHTRNKNQNGGGYNYNETNILGFGQIHDWMLSGVEVMPARISVDPRGGENAWKSEFSHEDEIVQPGYQRVYLRDPAVWTELTATERVSFYRFTFTEDGKSKILTNLGGYLGNSMMKDAEISRTDDQGFEGSFNSTDRFWGGPRNIRVYFRVEYDHPFDRLNGWIGDERMNDVREISGDGAGVEAIYSTKPGDTLLMKISISYTSLENAGNNMQEELPGWNFKKVRQDTRDIWNNILGKIIVEGGETEQRVKFYTDLWHVLLGRHQINDVSGDYPDRTGGTRDGTFTDADLKVRTLPHDESGRLKFNMYNSDGFWLTQWNLNVLWGLAWPSVEDDISASMLQYARNGYLLPRGPSGGGYSYIMTSSPTTMLVASAIMKNILTKADPEEAYKLLRQNHMPGGMLGDAQDIEFYIKKGYWPDNAGITLEATFQDYALSQLAKKLGLKRDQAYFEKRSMGWQKLFDPESKLLLPKGRDGRFLHHDLLSGKGWIEANAWQATWAVSHDLDKLAELMGGTDTLCARLNYAFEQAAPSDFVFGYSDGYVSYANQPGCSNAHVFNYAGKPWLTQYWVRQVKEKAYGATTPDMGYGGHDEDQGQMGGVSALMAIGLFSVKGTTSQTPVYEITSPVFDRVTIQLDPDYYPGKEVTIIARNNSRKNMYIQSATWNGNPLNRFWISHDEFIHGGTLEIDLGPQPNKEWGTAK